MLRKITIIQQDVSTGKELLEKCKVVSAKTLYCRGKVDVSVRIRIKKRSNFLELSIIK